VVILDLFDSHLHLDDEAFAADREAALERARAAGVRGFACVGTSLTSSRRAIALAEAHSDVYASVAIHPHDAADATPEALRELEMLARRPRVVAIGETGLDFYRNFAPRQVQEDAFRAHLALAATLRLPVIIHNRDAHAEVLHILADAAPVRVIMHCFSGSLEIARTCLDRGYYIGLGGPVTCVLAGSGIEGLAQSCIAAGANKVISPYVIGGMRIAQAVLRPNVVDFIELATHSEYMELQMEEILIRGDSKLAGRSLRDSGIRIELGIIVVAIKKKSGHMEFNPPAVYVIEEADTLIVLGQPVQIKALEKLATV